MWKLWHVLLIADSTDLPFECVLESVSTSQLAERKSERCGLEMLVREILHDDEMKRSSGAWSSFIPESLLHSLQPTFPRLNPSWLTARKKRESETGEFVSLRAITIYFLSPLISLFNDSSLTVSAHSYSTPVSGKKEKTEKEKRFATFEQSRISLFSCLSSSSPPFFSFSSRWKLLFSSFSRCYSSLSFLLFSHCDTKAVKWQLLDSQRI